MRCILVDDRWVLIRLRQLVVLFYEVRAGLLILGRELLPPVRTLYSCGMHLFFRCRVLRIATLKLS